MQPMHLSGRRGVRTQSGSRCRRPTMPNGSCRRNGIKSNGANQGPVTKRATLMPSSSADALLFDLSRVVIDIDFNRAFSRWAGHARCDQKLIRERFRHDDAAYKRHQRGEIDSEEFLANLRASLAIDISDAQLLDGWNSILVGEMPGVSELLAKAAGSFPLTPLPIPTANTSSTGQISFPAFSVISKRSTCRRRLG
jgi:hypothetical protein